MPLLSALSVMKVTIGSSIYIHSLPILKRFVSKTTSLLAAAYIYYSITDKAKSSSRACNRQIILNFLVAFSLRCHFERCFFAVFSRFEKAHIHFIGEALKIGSVRLSACLFNATEREVGTAGRSFSVMVSAGLSPRMSRGCVYAPQRIRGQGLYQLPLVRR